MDMLGDETDIQAILGEYAILYFTFCTLVSLLSHSLDVAISRVFWRSVFCLTISVVLSLCLTNGAMQPGLPGS